MSSGKAKKEEKNNFECKICEPGEAVFSSKAALSAHVSRKHLKKVEESDFMMSNKKARPKIYQPSDKTKKKKHSKKKGGAITKEANKQKQGVIEIPILLKIPFYFDSPQISQDIETQMIEIDASRKKG